MTNQRPSGNQQSSNNRAQTTDADQAVDQRHSRLPRCFNRIPSVGEHIAGRERWIQIAGGTPEADVNDLILIAESLLCGPFC